MNRDTWAIVIIIGVIALAIVVGLLGIIVAPLAKIGI